MKKLKLTVSNLAAEDLTNIWLYIADYPPQAAEQLIDTIFQKCCLLTESPGIGQMRAELTAAAAVNTFSLINHNAQTTDIVKHPHNAANCAQ